MSGGVYHAMKFIDKVGVVPLTASGLLQLLPNPTWMFEIKDLELYNFEFKDTFPTVLQWYARVHNPLFSIISLYNKSSE